MFSFKNYEQVHFQFKKSKRKLKFILKLEEQHERLWNELETSRVRRRLTRYEMPHTY